MSGPAMPDAPRIIIPVGRCDWCDREAIGLIGPYVACEYHADARHAPPSVSATSDAAPPSTRP